MTKRKISDDFVDRFFISESGISILSVNEIDKDESRGGCKRSDDFRLCAMLSLTRPWNNFIDIIR